MLRMTTTLGVSIICLMWIVPCLAQDVPVPIESHEDIDEFCTTSEPKGDRDDSRYQSRRKKHASTTFSTFVGHDELPILDYDEVRGALEVPVFRPIHVVEGVSLALDTPQMIRFNLVESNALEAAALYKLGRARIEIRFLPSTYARWDEKTCQPTGAAKVLKVALLDARLVDESRREIASYQSDLGREVEMLRAHEVEGYLGSAYPAVRVSAMVAVEESSEAVKYERRGLKAVARKRRVKTRKLGDEGAPLSNEIERELFGCYVRGLSRNARLQGALVVLFDFEQPERTRILVDSVHEREVSSCALERLRAMARAPVVRPENTSQIRLTTIFQLRDSGGL